MKRIFTSSFFSAFFICFLFFIAYSVLSVIRHNHFLSGYDLAIIDQAIWKYSRFIPPITTINAYAFTSILTDHVELIFILLAPFYWIINDVRILLILQALAISFSGLAVFLLCQNKKLHIFVSYALLISYLLFYGVQNAIWADAHSLVFGISFLAWFLYFLETKNKKFAWLFFILAIICKEDLSLFALLISSIVFIVKKETWILGFIAVSCLYLFSIFFIYFPHFVPGGYRFQNGNSLLSHIDFRNLYNTKDKRDVLLFSSLWYGLLPFLSPLFLIPALGDIAHYFILGNTIVTSAQSIFLHYRVSLALFLVWPTIVTIQKFQKLNNIIIALYVLGIALFFQYYLHLPLSYLAKSWFWTQPQSVISMEKILQNLPPTTPVVTQVNILPHISHRNLVFLMWPNKKDFKQHSPCGQKTCLWFRWSGNPVYMIIDTSTDWDARYWLTNRTEFIEGITNLEKEKTIVKIASAGTTTMYKILHSP